MSNVSKKIVTTEARKNENTKKARGWKAMRPESLKAKNNSSLQASQLPSLPAFKLSFLFRVFVIILDVF
jgi:hypothetical protein